MTNLKVIAKEGNPVSAAAAKRCLEKRASKNSITWNYIDVNGTIENIKDGDIITINSEKFLAVHGMDYKTHSNCDACYFRNKDIHCACIGNCTVKDYEIYFVNVTDAPVNKIEMLSNCYSVRFSNLNAACVTFEMVENMGWPQIIERLTREYKKGTFGLVR